MEQERLTAKEEVARQAESVRLKQDRSLTYQATEAEWLERERLAAVEAAKYENEVAVPRVRRTRCLTRRKWHIRGGVAALTAWHTGR